MPFDPIDLIKNISPSARCVLEVSESPTALTEIFRVRALGASIVVVAPGEERVARVLEAGVYDCVVLFSGGLDSERLTRLFENLPARAQILAARDAMGPELTDALARAETTG